MWVPSLGQEDFLEKEVTIHSSFLAREIAWTEEPGHLQSIELQATCWSGPRSLDPLATHPQMLTHPDLPLAT